MKRFLFLLAISISVLSARTEEPAPAVEAVAAASPVAAAAPKVVVFLPEQVDTEWFWYYYSDTAQHIVQSKIEKALVNAGLDVIDLASIKKLQDAGSLQSIQETATARSLAAEAGATYAIIGRATAVKASQGEAYGVTVVRSNAEITARILRVSDGKVLAVEEASEQKGGQAARAAGQEALKAAGDKIARKLAASLKKLGTPVP